MRRLTELQWEHLRGLRDHDGPCLAGEARRWCLIPRVLRALERKNMVMFDGRAYDLTDSGRAAVEVNHAPTD